MTSSLVGSEMCIRDSPIGTTPLTPMEVSTPIDPDAASDTLLRAQEYFYTCLLYTSDAADDM
eukprot:5184684-Prorocentrum_lima.AAC.1